MANLNDMWELIYLMQRQSENEKNTTEVLRKQHSLDLELAKDPGNEEKSKQLAEHKKEVQDLIKIGKEYEMKIYPLREKIMADR